MADQTPEKQQAQKGPSTDDRDEAAATSAAADYQPSGGDDLVPQIEDRPADGELGAGD